MTRMRMIVVVAVACLAMGAPVARGAGVEEKPQTPQEKAVAAQLARQIPEIHFSGQGLEDVVDFMRDVSGANLFVNWRALEAAGIKKGAPVTLRVKNVTLKAALEAIVDAVGTERGKAAFVVEDGVVVISAKADPTKPAARVTIGAIPPAMDRVLPEVNFNGQGFADVVDFLRDVSGMKLNVEWKALGAAGVGRDSPVTVRLRGVALSTVLKFVLESVSDGKTPLRVTWAENVATVTTGPEKPAEGAGR
jgi:hypothetical protein